MNNINLKKSSIRSKFIYLRNQVKLYHSSVLNSQIISKIKSLEEYIVAQSIMFYLSFGSEVNIDNLIEFSLYKNKTVLVPKIINKSKNTMCAIQISNIKYDIIKSTYGIREPNFQNMKYYNKNNINLIFIPGVVFDVHGYRIGYGKGYYDRWLQNIPKCKIIGIAYDFQIVKNLPIEQYDLSVGTIVT
ncbi:MAG: 5-formyltetrahydrofolate cyclo-ligase, partial [Endomicrobium sp.]|nr:5-formyltetrahydrofolate cyclo-ligase [Endomicrobium sp.]